MNLRLLLASQVMMKRSRNLQLTLLFTLGLTLWLFLAGRPVLAQQGPGQIIITGTDASSAPTIQLHVYATDGQGNPVSLDPNVLTILHNGNAVSDISIGAPYEAGTFTIFVLDIPQGVSAYIPTIQTAIQQYAGEQTMMEQVDSVAIFAVDELAPSQILAASEFRNEIANTFATPLTPITGATALVDSLMSLLNNLDSLKPRSDMTPQIVVFSDGTDVVSTQNEASDVPKLASELGVPIYTVVLNNESLDEDESQTGQNYMGQIAAGTHGQSTRLSTAEELQPFWERIATFRNQTTVQYSIEEATGGDHTVVLSLTNNPNVGDTAVVTIPPGAPSISIDLPADSRSLTLPNLNEAVALSFSTKVSWLDDVDREIQKAQLLVNGLILQDLDVKNLDKFDVELSNLKFGPNQIQIAIVDSEGSRATSPVIVIEIAEGETSIPEAVAPSGLFGRIWQRISGVAVFIGGCFGVVIFVVLLIGLMYLARRSPILRQIGLIGLLGRIPFIRPYFSDVYKVQSQAGRAGSMKDKASRYSPDVKSAGSGRGKNKPQLAAFLEVLQATTQLPGRLDLDKPEVKLGRSPSRADISFKDDGTVSRVHATIVQEGAGYRLFDDRSTSGTFVNEQGVLDQGLQLVDGDEIRLGAVRLRFRQP
jgi:hypothetical protein